MEQALKSMEQMMQQLVEDRRQREEEFANERATWQRAADDRIREMQAQTDRLMRLVHDSRPSTEPTPAKLLRGIPQVKLVPLTEQDDIEAYLVTFERIMQAYDISREQWTYYIAPQLTGKAQQAFAALPTGESKDYDGVKAAILTRYGVSEETYRRRFRASTRNVGETNRELAMRLMDLQDKWLKTPSSMREIKEVIGIEQFLTTLPLEKRAWVKERKPETCVKAGELADEYELARNLESQDKAADILPRKPPSVTPKKWCGYCKTAGHVKGECSKLAQKRERDAGPNHREAPKPTRKPPIRCFNCKKEGHIAAKCPGEPALLCEKSTTVGARSNTVDVWQRTGTVEGQFVPEIVLDTACKRTMVRQELVPPWKIIEGDVATIRCAHGDTVLYPLANVSMEIDGRAFEVEAAVSATLPVSVLLGGDVPELKLLIGDNRQNKPTTSEDVMVVVTRSQAKRQLEEEIIRREREILSGVKPRPVEDLQTVPGKESCPPDSTLPTLTQEQRRAFQQQMGSKGHGSEGNGDTAHYSLEFSADELTKLQETDETLGKIRKAIMDHPSQLETAEYFKRDGLIYRRWTPPGRGRECEVEQLVLPKTCRKKVLELGHVIPLAGHLGAEKTRQRILHRFYWPTIFRDVDEYCRSCEKCQKTNNRKVPPAPLIPLPVITEPFRRIAMDIVGPLPRSRLGNRFILVICDYATRYPEAIPLRSIDAVHIAEELIKVFAHLGIPEEILTDQGSNFTSQLLAELYRLLHVHPIRTSPYHPQTDGLVERFNQTLKSMLRKAATEEGKDWDKLVPYLLFAYREVPQASTGFSPFELLYGRDVRGPLDILRESWESSQRSDENIISYVLSTRDKLSKMAELVQENLSKAQARQKSWYDKNARVREFQPGDPVLVLLPTATSKLLAQWQGPYQVVKRMGKVTYMVDMHDHKKRRRVFHVNMLKTFQIHQLTDSSYLVTDGEGDSEDGDILFWLDGTPDDRPLVGQGLNNDQRQQLQQILTEFREVLQNKPGHTKLVEHRIEIGTSCPVKLPPYRLPQAYRESVQKEIQEMLEQDIIEPSSSEWAAPIVLVKKKDGSLRLCVDYRRLNSVSRTDAYPMPRIDDMIDQLGRASFISTLDLTRGYWQVPVANIDRHKTAFITPFGLYQFKAMPFGLQGAPATFQRMMDQLIRGLEGFTAAYLDDLVIYSSTWEEHVKHLHNVFGRLRKAGLTAKPRKCQFAMKQCKYLGHIVGNGVVQPEPGKIDAVKSFAVPRTKTDVRAFLGLTGYYRRFIPDYATIALPLTDLTRKAAPNLINWNDQCNEAFTKLKELLCSSPVLQSPNFTMLFTLQTDASDRGVGAVLSQKDESGLDHPVSYYSRKLLPREQRYSTVEKELLAIKLATSAFRVYLLGRHFQIVTDHRSLEWLDRLKETNSRLTRWSLALQSFDFSITHRPGKDNGNADALSRIATN